MVDEIFDRQYQAGRAELHGGVRRAIDAVSTGMKALHRIEWSAPWNTPSKPERRDAGCA